MPYNNPLNRQIAEQMRTLYEKHIKNTQMSYDIAEGNVGYANKKIIDSDNIVREGTRLEELEENLPENNEDYDTDEDYEYNHVDGSDTDKDEDDYNDNDEIDDNMQGGSLGSKGGFARGTIRDTGEGRTLGAGLKNKVNEHKANEKKKTKSLLLKRVMEGGKFKRVIKESKLKQIIKDDKKLPDLVRDIGMIKKLKGRPSLMKGGADLGEPHNMIDEKGITGNGKKSCKKGGNKEGVVSTLPGSSMSGMGKNKSRSEIVKEIMKKRGVSMIEASKIVKAENLYKPKIVVK